MADLTAKPKQVLRQARDRTIQKGGGQANSTMGRPRWYVYHLIDPRDESVFYVGKGSGDRIKAHEAEARSDICNLSPKLERIRDIWAAGFEVRRQVVAMFWGERDAFSFERQEILARKDELTNVVGRNDEPRDFDSELERLLEGMLFEDPIGIDIRKTRVRKLVNRLEQAGDMYRVRIASKVLAVCDAENPWQRLQDSLNNWFLLLREGKLERAI